MKKLMALTILLAACGADVKEKNKDATDNNGIVINNGGTSTNNGETNNVVKTNNATATNTSNNTTKTTNTIPPEDCGNGELDTTEACEGFELRGKTCASEGFDGGMISCTNTCELDLSDCEACGNGVIEGDEECDGDKLGGQTCEDFIAGTIGELECTRSCLITPESCVAKLAKCSELAECLNLCNQADENCVNGCTDRASQRSVDFYVAVSICVQDNNCMDQECVQQFCSAEATACFSEDPN